MLNFWGPFAQVLFYQKHKQLQNRNVDGIIYNTYKKSEECLKHFEELSKSIPVIFMDHSFEKNSDIDTEQLMEALKQIGFSKGRVYQRSVLKRVIQELKQQYLHYIRTVLFHY